MVNKHKVEAFIIPRAGTVLPTAGDDLYDSVTDQVNLPVGGFGVQGRPVVGGRGLLLVAEERLADVAERDRFGVLERVDGRVLASAVAGPRAEQRSQNGDVEMDRWSHRQIVRC